MQVNGTAKIRIVIFCRGYIYRICTRISHAINEDGLAPVTLQLISSDFVNSYTNSYTYKAEIYYRLILKANLKAGFTAFLTFWPGQQEA